MLISALIMVVTGYDEKQYDYYQWNYDNYIYESAAISSCEIVDILGTTSCPNVPEYPLSIWAASGGLVSGTPLICGGEFYDYEFRNRHMSDDCYIYNVSTNTWKFLAKMSLPRSASASIALNQSLWVTGGTTQYNRTLGLTSHNNSSEIIYLDGSVIPGPELPSNRDDHCMVTLHDNRVMILGSNEKWNEMDEKNVIIYDPHINSFTTAPSLLYNRNGAACALIISPLHGNRPVVLAAGGLNTNTAEILDYTFANEWEPSRLSQNFM